MKKKLILFHSIQLWCLTLTLFHNSPPFCCCLFPCFFFRIRFSLSARDRRLYSTSATPTRTPADSLPDSVSRSIGPMAAPSSADQPAGSPMDASWSTSSVSAPHPFDFPKLIHMWHLMSTVHHAGYCSQRSQSLSLSIIFSWVGELVCNINDAW